MVHSSKKKLIIHYNVFEVWTMFFEGVQGIPNNWDLLVPDIRNTRIKESCKKIKTMTKWVIYKWRYELWGLNIFLFTYYILYNV